MPLTNDDTVPDAIGALFDEFIFPLSQHLHAEGSLPLLLKPDPALKSYYVERTQAAMVHEDFTAPSCLDIDEFAQRLGAYWQSRGRDELLAAVPRIAAAACVPQADSELDRTHDSEVSPFIYVMF